MTIIQFIFALIEGLLGDTLNRSETDQLRSEVTQKYDAADGAMLKKVKTVLHDPFARLGLALALPFTQKWTEDYLYSPAAPEYDYEDQKFEDYNHATRRK